MKITTFAPGQLADDFRGAPLRATGAHSPTNAPKTVASLDSAAATRAWLETVPAEKRARSDAYFEGGYWLILWNFLLGAAISLLLLGSGLSARLRDFAERITRFRTLQVRPSYAVPYVVIVAVLSFPLGSIPTIFGNTPTGWQHKLSDPGSGAAHRTCGRDRGDGDLDDVALCRLSARRRTWWLWGTGVGVLFLVVSTLIAPVFIAPLFNTYKPITDQKISQPILRWRALTKSRCGRFSRWTRRGKAIG